MKHSLFTALALTLVTIAASPAAQALSCMMPDVTRAMQDAKASEDVYYILVGTFTPVTPIKTPIITEDFNQTPDAVQTSMAFNGYGLSQLKDHDVPLSDFAVTAEITCALSWCGGLPDANSPQIAFVKRQSGQGPLLTMEPCPRWTFQASEKRVETLRACFDNTCG